MLRDSVQTTMASVHFAVFVAALMAACLPPPVRPCDSNFQAPSAGEECTDVSTEPFCGRFYQGSFFPNDIATTSEGATGLVAFYLRSNQTCSPYLSLYVCLAVLPVCEPTNSSDGRAKVRLPCKEICQRVQSDCSREKEFESILDVQCVYHCDLWPDTDCVGLEDPLVAAHVTHLDPTPSSRPEATPQATTVQNNDTCPPVDQVFFSDESKTFAKGWIGFWSVICYLSTLVTLLTFLLDTSRFQYPWRPVVYLALSFHIHTLGYFLALIIGPSSVTCPGGSYVETDSQWTWIHTPCILVFGLLYYSTIAAFLWWLILTLSWFLSSAYKWTNEAISQFSLFYHTAAWVIPLILTISVLAARVVSADELTGTCFIVRTNTRTSFLAMLFGLILPLSVLLLVGSAFLTIGLLSVLQIRKFMVNRGKERESIILEKLMLRIGVYVAIYVLPAAVLIGCFIYELDTRPRWHTASDPCTDCSRPNTAVFMVRIFMFLLIGALTGAWIWSRKTLQSWRRLPTKLQNCVFPPTSERTQDSEKAATRLGSFTSPPQPHPSVRVTPSYPYTIDSATEFSA
jgi:hypothetical protein